MSVIDQLPYLEAQVSHGPGMHGPVLLIVVVIVAVGGLVYLVKSRTRRTRFERDSDSERDPSRDRGPEA